MSSSILIRGEQTVMLRKTVTTTVFGPLSHSPWCFRTLVVATTPPRQEARETRGGERKEEGGGERLCTSNNLLPPSPFPRQLSGLFSGRRLLSSEGCPTSSSTGLDKVSRSAHGDAIILKGLTFFAKHGVLPEEATLGQKFTVDLKLHCCLLAAGKTDDVDKTIDYSQVYQAVKDVVAGDKRYNLLETIAHDIVSIIFRNFPQVEEVNVCVKKPHVALMGDLEYSAVQIHRTRSGIKD